MKKILPILIVLVLVLSGLGAAAFSETKLFEKTQTKKIQQKISFKSSTIDDIGDFVVVQPETLSRLRNPGGPDLPMKVEVFYLPFGAQNVQVQFTPNNIHEQILSKDVLPASEPVPLIYKENNEIDLKKDLDLYSELYPSSWYSVKIGGGLNPENNMHATIVSVQTYPVRYLGIENKLLCLESANVEITYDQSTNPVTFEDEYDLVIIAPEKFSFFLQRLITHKEKFGVKTTLKTVESIYEEYDGFDKPEEIKLFIKDAIEQWNITYVLLVGGLNNYKDAQDRENPNEGSTFWHVPVRYTNLYDGGGTQDPGAISDLYYADIYDGEGNFSSWDSNEDGIMAAWGRPSTPNDVLDLFPDVYVGRLACRNILEVILLVQKIIVYEKRPAASSWFNKMVCIAGDSFSGYGSEGENTINAELEYMTDFEPVKVYASNRELGEGLTPTIKNVTRSITQGCGFLSFEGHGNPSVWATHWTDSDVWTDMIDVGNFTKFFNGRKLPICVVGGCHNSQINVTLNKTENGPDHGGYWTHGAPIPECWSWWMTRKVFGGSIATLGQTALGYGLVGPTDPIGLSAYLDLLFFWSYGEQGNEILGETAGAALTRYISEMPTYQDGKSDTKTVSNWLLLGDPSLMIGGYD